MDESNDKPRIVNSDGELIDDALYEWDGEQWVEVEYDPLPIIDVDLIFSDRISSPEQHRRTDNILHVLFGKRILMVLIVLYVFAIAVFLLYQLYEDQTVQAIYAEQRETRAAQVATWDAEAQVVSTENSRQQATMIVINEAQTEAAQTRPPLCNTDYLTTRFVAFTTQEWLIVQPDTNANTFCRLTDQRINGSISQFSHNGQRLYFLDNGLLTRYDFETGDLSQIIGIPAIDDYAISPDETLVVYIENTNVYLKTIDAQQPTSTALRQLDITGVVDIEFTRDGENILIVQQWLSRYRILRMSIASNEIVNLYEQAQPINALSLAPDQRSIALMQVVDSASTPTYSISFMAMVEENTLSPITSVEDIAIPTPYFVWAEDGERIIYYVDGALMIQGFHNWQSSRNYRFRLTRNATGFDIWYGVEDG